MKKIITMAAVGIMAAGLGLTAGAQEEKGILPAIAGENGTTYANLFEVILDEQYDQLWLDYCTEYVGEENAEAAAEMLKSSISAEVYGEEAIEAYADGGTAFDCWYINDAAAFTMNGDEITVEKTDGSTETHTYEYLGVYNVGEGETMEYNGEEMSVTFACDVYESTDEAGEFKYFLLRDDTMEETYHIEFRYGSDLEDLQGYFVGPYAYWLAAGIDQDADEETINAVIELFCSENLGGSETEAE
ncbi:MAG: hypothetical protein Q4B01_06420 [Eubacteriales bacterium]|nr:hypothetical protein [Eubacteriales bacterium]